MIRFIVPGQPQRKQRPRFRRKGAFVQTYTPKETLDYEQKIKECYETQIGQVRIDDVPLKIRIIAYFRVPASYSKRKRQEAVQHIIKPHNTTDVDNIAKVVLDALNKTAYSDDHYVTDLVIRKRYAEDPRLEIEIDEVKE